MGYYVRLTILYLTLQRKKEMGCNPALFQFPQSLMEGDCFRPEYTGAERGEGHRPTETKAGTHRSIGQQG